MQGLLGRCGYGQQRLQQPRVTALPRALHAAAVCAFIIFHTLDPSVCTTD